MNVWLTHSSARARTDQTSDNTPRSGFREELKVTLNTATQWPDFSSSNQQGTGCYGNHTMDHIHSGFVAVLLKIPSSCKSLDGRRSRGSAVTVKGCHKWERNHNSCWNGAARAHLSRTSGIFIVLHVSLSSLLFTLATTVVNRSLQ